MANTKQQVTRQIKGEIYDTLRSALVAPVSSKSKATWSEVFIKDMLETARKDPTGPLGQLLAKQILQDDIISSLDEQTERLLARDQDFLRYRLYQQCYKEQRDVLLDNYSKYILVNTGRRTGKTNLAARWLVSKCVTPNSPCFYIHLKFDNAIRQCFDLCVESAKKIELGIDKESKNEGIIVFSNGSSIKFCGNNNKSEADKLRGFKARGIVIDEAAFQINMNYLINDILTPLMADYTDSQMMLISTPPRIPHTYYEFCYRDSNWTKYEWYANKNPFIPSFDDFIKELCEKKGLTIDSPFIQREGYGQFVYDTEAQVFKDYKTYNADEPLDFIPDRVDIGVDIGFEDNNAIIALAYNNEKARVIFERKFNRAAVSEIIKQIQEVYSDSKKFLIENNKNANIADVNIYCDMNNKELVYELYSVQKLPCFCCYKYNKAMAISQMAEFCRTSKIVIPKDGILADECDRTLYKRDDEDNILTEIDDELFHPDALMALLYACRQMWYNIGAPYGGQASEDWQ